MSDNQYETITEFEDDEEDQSKKQISRHKFTFNMRCRKIEHLKKELVDSKTQFTKDKETFIKQYQIVESEKNKAQTTLQECINEKNSLIKDLIKTSAILEMQQKHLRELQNQVDSYKNGSKMAPLEQDLQKEISKLKEQATNLQGEKSKLRVEMEESKNFICKLMDNLKEAQMRNNELFETMKCLNEDNDHLRNTLAKKNHNNNKNCDSDETKKLLRKKEEEINKLKRILKKYPPSVVANKSTQVNNLYNNKIEEMVMKQNQLVEVIDICEKQIHLLFEKLNNLQKENEKLVSNKTAHEEKIKQLQENCFKANEKVTELENTIINVNKESLQKDVVNEELKSQLQKSEDANRCLRLQIEQKEAKTQKIVGLYENLLKTCSVSEKSTKSGSGKNFSSSENSLESFIKNKNVLMVPRKILGEFEREINSSKSQIEELKYRVQDFNDMQTKITDKLNDAVQKLKIARHEVVFYKSKYKSEMEQKIKIQDMFDELKKTTTSLREKFRKDVEHSQNLCNKFMQQIAELEKESVGLAENLKMKEIELEERKDNEKKFEGVVKSVKQEALNAATLVESWRKMAMNLFNKYTNEIHSMSIRPERILSNINQVEEEIRHVEKVYKSKKLLIAIDQT